MARLHETVSPKPKTGWRKQCTHSMIKYATAKAAICNSALVACCKRDGLNTPASELPFNNRLPMMPASLFPVSSVDALGEFADDTNLRWCSFMIYRSYSFPERRRNSRRITSRITPMQDPANMPLEVMCQLRERKQESTVYQFHNICG
jgi:hypothetical protein